MITISLYVFTFVFWLALAVRASCLIAKYVFVDGVKRHLYLLLVFWVSLYYLAVQTHWVLYLSTEAQVEWAWAGLEILEAWVLHWSLCKFYPMRARSNAAAR